MLEAQLRYYDALNQATSEYLRSIVDAFEELLLVFSPISVRPFSAFVDPFPAAPRGRPMLPQPPSAPPALVLEAPAGGEAVGVFLAENHLGRRVSAPIVASVFTDPSGREVSPRLTFEPSEINLGEGEQVLVRVGLTVGGDLEPGVDHRGEVTVPGLPGGRIRLVVRRYADQLKRTPRALPSEEE
jgi:hypothetical protein